MLNQVEFEGYLTRSWDYREQRFLRLANHRPGENGRTFSDYVTVQIDSALDLGARRIKIGQLVRVTGRIIGRDIVEPLRLVVGKSHEGVELPGELGKLIVRRPTIQILATQVKIQADAKRLKKSKETKAQKQPALLNDDVLPTLDIEKRLESIA
ncbi:MAG: hypothetical protein JNM55_21010 [Anaerolineales bacterium]|nr:hypothetical protein [Anaerolineales bacterium]